MGLQISDERIIVDVLNGFNNLIRIKAKYHVGLSDDPDHRARVIPMMIGFNRPIVLDVKAQLHALTESGIEASYVAEITDMVTNYNILLNLWMLRNRYYKKLLPLFYKEMPSKTLLEGDVGFDYAHLVDITEQVIGYTDSLILDKNNFLTGQRDFKLAQDKKDLLEQCVPVHQMKLKHIVDTLEGGPARAS